MPVSLTTQTSELQCTTLMTSKNPDGIQFWEPRRNEFPRPAHDCKKPQLKWPRFQAPPAIQRAWGLTRSGHSLENGSAALSLLRHEDRDTQIGPFQTTSQPTSESKATNKRDALPTHGPSTYRWMLSTRVLMELGRFQGSSWMLIWIKFRPRTVHSSFCLNSGTTKWHEVRRRMEAQKPMTCHQITKLTAIDQGN